MASPAPMLLAHGFAGGGSAAKSVAAMTVSRNAKIVCFMGRRESKGRACYPQITKDGRILGLPLSASICVICGSVFRQPQRRSYAATLCLLERDRSSIQL